MTETDFHKYHSKVGRRHVSRRGVKVEDCRTSSLAVDNLQSHEDQTHHRCHRTSAERLGATKSHWTTQSEQQN